MQVRFKYVTSFFSVFIKTTYCYQVSTVTFLSWMNPSRLPTIYFQLPLSMHHALARSINIFNGRWELEKRKNTILIHLYQSPALMSLSTKQTFLWGFNSFFTKQIKGQNRQLMIDIFVKCLRVFDLYTSRDEVYCWPVNFSSTVESPLSS